MAALHLVERASFAAIVARPDVADAENIVQYPCRRMDFSVISGYFGQQ
jgi:hypothetical protein